jgi:hypothetical protein
MDDVIVRANWRVLHDGQEFLPGVEFQVGQATAERLGAAVAILAPAPDAPADETKPARKAKG